MPEMLIAIVILSIIIGPLTAALIVYVRNSDTTVIRMGESHDVQIAASYFGQDISSLGMRDASLNFVQSVNNAAFPCTAAGTSVVLLAWDESTATGSTTVRVNYVDRVVAGERQLRRVQCRGNATPVSDVVVVHNLVGTPGPPSCPGVPSCTSAGANLPRQVILTMSIHHPQGTGSPISLTLTGQRRQS
jgi:hypothetical protein